MKGDRVIGQGRCPICRTEFDITTRDSDKVYCSVQCAGLASRRTVVNVCANCGKTFEQPAYKNRSFCSKKCASLGRWKDPELRAKYMSARSSKTPLQREVASLRLKAMNKDREFRAKSDAARRGKGFVGERGGNGTLTPQQIALAEATGYETEYPVPTGNPRWRCALMDLANPALKLAVEVDGLSHSSRAQQNRDRIKERMLHALGWVVLRFTNEEIDSDLARVVMEIKAMEHIRSTDLRASRRTEESPRTKQVPSRAIESIEPPGNHESVPISVALPNKLYLTNDDTDTCAGSSQSRGELAAPAQSCAWSARREVQSEGVLHRCLGRRGIRVDSGGRPRSDPHEPDTLATFESEPDWELEHGDIPELTPAILTKMFANMQANGYWHVD
jgi:endogenous inhibitor of DNA gyrase (YacG/DUF329 family)